MKFILIVALIGAICGVVFSLLVLYVEQQPNQLWEQMGTLTMIVIEAIVWALIFVLAALGLGTSSPNS